MPFFACNKIHPFISRRGNFKRCFHSRNIQYSRSALLLAGLHQNFTRIMNTENMLVVRGRDETAIATCFSMKYKFSLQLFLTVKFNI